MKTVVRHTVCFALMSMLCAPSAFAKGPDSEVAKLGKELTPLGAIAAANADGSIPAWDGGIKSPPSGYSIGMHHPDPFAADKPLFRITPENVDKYSSKLSPGQIALFKRYKDSWFMDVYPSHRSAALPDYVYQATIKNASTATTTEDGNGVLNAGVGVPFPIPQKGVEAIWNHLLRFRGDTFRRDIGQAAPTAGGDYTMVRISEKVIWPYNQKGATVESVNNRLAYFLQEVTAPPRLAGTILLVHETLNQHLEPRNAWTYNPGQRRVRRAPNIAYDNPGTASDSQRTSDQLDMFNGAPDRYDWTLVGRKEMYVPYNSYKLHSDKVKEDDIIKAGHIDQNFARYELHRVWVVEAKLKEGMSHIYKRRTFYIDEDSWQILAVDQYDNRDQIWRVSEAHTINYYEMPLVFDTLQLHYDLQNGRYLAFGLNNQEPIDTFNVPLNLVDFAPEALRREGMR